MLVLKIIKKNKIWNIPKYVVINTSLEPMPQNLAKMKSGANYRLLYLPMSSLPHTFFWCIWQTLWLSQTLSFIKCVALRPFLEIRGPTCEIFVIADYKNSHNGRSLKFRCIFFTQKHTFFISVTHTSNKVVWYFFPNTTWEKSQKNSEIDEKQIVILL